MFYNKQRWFQKEDDDWWIQRSLVMIIMGGLMATAPLTIDNLRDAGFYNVDNSFPLLTSINSYSGIGLKHMVKKTYLKKLNDHDYIPHMTDTSLTEVFSFYEKMTMRFSCWMWQ